MLKSYFHNIRALRKSPHLKAFTLLEITLVIGIVVGLASLTIVGLGNSTRIANAARAEAAMRMIESARLSYLSDNPQVVVGNITAANLDRYIPGGTAAAINILTDNGYIIRMPADIRTARIGYTIPPADAARTLRLKGFEFRP